MTEVEAEVRLQIDQLLKAKGWVIEPGNPKQDVFVETAVKSQLSSVKRNRLEGKIPDYTLFHNRIPTAVIEAKKPSVVIGVALEQGIDYAKRIGVDFAFACNGPVFRTFHLPTEEPLYVNGREVTAPLGPALLFRFKQEKTNSIHTIPKDVIKSREQLIEIFERLNNILRTDGIRAGLDRFSEFANFLFLKLLSEQGQNDGTWEDLVNKSERDLPGYVNDYAIKQLREKYKSDVLSKTAASGRTIKSIVKELEPLSLSSVDEDIKGVAFEHFLGRSTSSSQNDLGEYFTPRDIVKFMVELLNPKLGDRILDPFCGTGGFLIQSFYYLGQFASNSRKDQEILHRESLYGQEITKNARIAKMNMILFGDGHSGVIQCDSLRSSETDNEFDCVLSNIPFSLELDKGALRAINPNAKNADEACLLKCFDSLRTGGSMAVIVPEGLVVNKMHRDLWRLICQQSRVRARISLPRGAFAPYTTAGTQVIYLTDKGTKKTSWFYDISFRGEGPKYSSIKDLCYNFQKTGEPLEHLPEGFNVVLVENLENASSFCFNRPWEVADIPVIELGEVADITNGKTITKKTAEEGDIPVISGGAGSVPFYHNQFNEGGGASL